MDNVEEMTTRIWEERDTLGVIGLCENQWLGMACTYEIGEGRDEDENHRKRERERERRR